MAIRLLPPTPQRTDDPTTFVSKADAWMSAIPGLVSDINTTAANLNSIAFGGAFSIPYTINTGAAGPGVVAMYSSNDQRGSPTWYFGETDAAGNSLTQALNYFTASGSAIKGTVRIVKVGDTTRWVRFSLTAQTASSGTFRTFSVSPIDGSSATPFATGDSVILWFQPTGDVGSPGTLLRRTWNGASTGSNTDPLSPNVANTDIATLSGQAFSLLIGTPTGTPLDGQGLMYRIKDNGTARTISYTTAYRASVELPFPSTTVVGKTLYLGFIYNAADAKWDLISALNSV